MKAANDAFAHFKIEESHFFPEINFLKAIV